VWSRDVYAFKLPPIFSISSSNCLLVLFAVPFEIFHYNLTKANGTHLEGHMFKEMSNSIFFCSFVGTSSINKYSHSCGFPSMFLWFDKLDGDLTKVRITSVATRIKLGNSEILVLGRFTIESGIFGLSRKSLKAGGTPLVIYTESSFSEANSQ
jgi:hypothetical protein